MKPKKFGSWKPWEEAPEFTQESFVETINGGQAFRWKQVAEFYEGRWSSNVVRLRYNDGVIEYSLPIGCELVNTLKGLRNYFACDTDFSYLAGSLPWRSDPILATAIKNFTGLRILRQPLAETLLCFLCSSTKQIPQIKAICEALAHDLGNRLEDGSYALPDWDSIASAGEQRLRSAKLGYRARYIYKTALFLAERPDWLEETEAAPTQEARARLMELPGVGRKIADCTLLFGAGRLEAFPIDTWVEKILTRAYQLKGLKQNQLQDFASIHFGAAAGYAQQYLFAAARAGYIPS
ncbi:MAG: DNA glycosylase [Verrucomicrobiota bacterium]|nr:DNA glycosylase [Verrucomicrobiota bacterium]MEC8332832.1 DNA glycosylase [Verrucomicrobiota bacterium]